MPAPEVTNDDRTSRELCQAWRAWSRHVSRALRSNRPNARDAKYRDLHGNVLAAIERRREAVGDQDALKHALSVVRPWVDLEACRKAPTAIQRDLLWQCEECERGFCGKTAAARTAKPLIRRVEFQVLALLGLVVLGFMIVYDGNSLALQTRYHLWRIGAWITHGSIFERVAAGAAAMFGIGWWMLHSLRPN